MAEINLKKLTAGVSDIDVNFNGNLEGQADATIPLNVNLTDGVSDITPTSVALTGNDLDITIVPSGVLFKTIEASRYTSFRTGDEGWRAQNGFFDYTPPSNPATIAELDYSIGANFFYKLKNPLIVNGVSSTTRFVDLNGVQVFSATQNANIAFIDKLTGLMFTRFDLGTSNWNTAIDNALSYSVVIKTITYDDWFLPTINEYLNTYGCFATTQWNDPITTNRIANNINAFHHSSTTLSEETTYDQSFRFMNTASGIYYDLKTTNRHIVYIRNARNLITAP